TAFGTGAYAVTMSFGGAALPAVPLPNTQRANGAVPSGRGGFAGLTSQDYLLSGGGGSPQRTTARPHDFLSGGCVSPERTTAGSDDLRPEESGCNCSLGQAALSTLAAPVGAEIYVTPMPGPAPLGYENFPRAPVFNPSGVPVREMASTPGF